MAILIAGNVEVLKESDLLKMFPEEKVIALGKVSESKHRIRSIDWKNQTDIGRLLTVYHVTSILYFSKSVEPSKDLDGELLQIRKILNALTEDFFVEFLYVTGPDLRFETENSRGVMLSAYEQLLRRYSQQQHFSLKILQSLYLYQLSNSTDDLRSILTSDKDITLHPDQKAYYIFGRDLLDLCRRIFDNWTNTFERIEVPDSFGITFQQLFEELNIHGATFSEEAPLSVLKPQTSNLRKDYGWFPKVSLLEDLSTRDLPTSAKEQKTLSLADRLRKLAKLDKTSVKVIVLIVLFILGEMLSHLLSNQMYFKTVDYRLFAIVISGLSLGMFYGIWAAVFASIGLIIQNILAGETNLQTLFFEPANWIPYIIYLVSGLVSGYVKEKDQADLFRILAENEHLEQQLSDEESFVEDLLSEKVELTHQILERQDSYGRIYRFLEDLETPYLEIFMVKLLDYISNIFDTDEIAIYEVRDNQTSKLQLTTAQNTTHLMLTAEQLSKVSQQLVNNTVWVNQHLRDDYPMYLAGIFANGDLHYYLSLDHLPTDKLNLYHQNLLKSLMGLASLSYRRLYQKTTSNVQHEILEEKVFCQKLLALRAVDSPYFVGQVLHLGVVAEEIPKTTLTSLQEELSLFDSLGQVESQLCLLINTYTQSLTDWHEKLSDLSFDVTDERNIEETIESIAFRQMMS
ncbi:hypothetical protein SAMN05660328_101228 [Streptococcus gallolyticus]|uniref:Uncharacterized protein n=1 Tax=Streptococcus gallolyticus TaxID=315405 RepID=A0A1I7F6Z0_9STRE|nr:hypothetical protein [Streptococcus gallolyticus]SFC02753.1 hypothetical protein SAMN02983012_0374 [Streptococcus gallolyticus]SFU31896.1 hypothetical protein SAMN05660328_101228 [Streptococcus gallolyticus]